MLGRGVGVPMLPGMPTVHVDLAERSYDVIVENACSRKPAK